MIVTKLDAPKPTRLGFLVGQGNVPEDFDTFGDEEIQAMFDGSA